MRNKNFDTALNNYHKSILTMAESRGELLAVVARDIIKNGNRIVIGNMVYSTADKETPTYCYLRDINTPKEKFYPIWDKEETHEFGWSDFHEVTRILITINKELHG